MVMGLGMILAAAAAVAQPAAECRPSAAAHRQIVSDFYAEALIGRKPAAAFERYMAPGFVEHKPDVPNGTREGAAAFLEGLIKEVPDPKWEVLRIVADGDLVALHARFTPAPGAPPYAIADFFRLKDCKIVEHWDVVAGPPKEQVNPKPRF
jgi:predicted SnoaL-like aldol condensation-catalyzing enzyme